jgi:GNAT superfamily N-acetyltransferase
METTTAIVIRDARECDVEAIVVLLGELGYESDPDVVRRNLDTMTRNGADRVFVALKDDRIVGLATYHECATLREPAPIGRITSMIVTERQRGGGIGSGLTRHIEQCAREHGCLRLEVTSALHRTEAHRFYTDRGFPQQGCRFVKHLLP